MSPNDSQQVRVPEPVRNAGTSQVAGGNCRLMSLTDWPAGSPCRQIGTTTPPARQMPLSTVFTKRRFVRAVGCIGWPLKFVQPPARHQLRNASKIIAASFGARNETFGRGRLLQLREPLSDGGLSIRGEFGFGRTR